MIIIDKRQSAHTIIATLSDKVFELSNTLLLKIKNNATNQSYELILPFSTSLFPSRYYKFYLTELPDYVIGTYIYSIVERDPNQLIELQVLEMGLLKIIGDEPTENIAVYTPTLSDDVVVYE